MKPLASRTSRVADVAVAGLLAGLALLALVSSPATAAAAPDPATLARMDSVIQVRQQTSGLPETARV
jgi:hypothetical protein